MSAKALRTSGCLLLACLAASMSLGTAFADDQSDCRNKSLPVNQRTDACNHYIKKLRGGTPNDVPPGETSIDGYFEGCGEGQRKVYQLRNGRKMECHSAFIYSGHSLKVQIISDVRVMINGKELSVIIY